MNRRHFSILIPATLATLPSLIAQSAHVKRPRPLKKGDTIALVTPSGPINEKRLQSTINRVEKLGFKTVHSDKVVLQNGYLAGTDQDRLLDLHDAFSNKKIDAIWCIRGGYGATRYLDQLDFDLIRENPKPLIGYSDITALLNTIFQHTGNPCFHGPVAGSSISEFTMNGMHPLFHEEGFTFSLSENNIEKGNEDPIYRYREIVPGIARGPLAGGNLSLLSAMVGTKHAVDAKGKLVFIEDVEEEPYRVDRMLTQLISSGFFDEATGIILGIFADCGKKDEKSWTLAETIDERMKNIGKPCAYGFSFGHIVDKITFPLGVEAEMNTSLAQVKLFGSPF